MLLLQVVGICPVQLDSSCSPKKQIHIMYSKIKFEHLVQITYLYYPFLFPFFKIRQVSLFSIPLQIKHFVIGKLMNGLKKKQQFSIKTLAGRPGMSRYDMESVHKYHNHPCLRNAFISACKFSS